MGVVILDNEAVSALRTPTSPKHPRTLSYVEADNGMRRRQTRRNAVVVPATVRVEAGWDRTEPTAASINRLGIEDHFLDERSADVAAELASSQAVSPADAHIGAVIAERAGTEIVVLTSDPDDIRRVAGTTRTSIVQI